MSKFIKKGNKYYRINEDGSQIEVTPTKEGYFTWTDSKGRKVRSQKRYKITPSKKDINYSFLDKLKLALVNSSNIENNVDDPYVINSSYQTKKAGHGVVPAAFILDRDKQRTLLENNGYVEVHDGDYGLVKKAVGDNNFPIFQKHPDVISRDNLVAIGNVDSDDSYVQLNDTLGIVKPTNWYADPTKALYQAGHHRSTLFWNPNTNKYYQQAWDLNDYGGSANYTNPFGLGDLLDNIGNRLVIKSGIQEVLPEYTKVLEGYRDNYLKQK